ncbi:MAG: methylmalonyl Co-A mutase-associated GTPase MeaB [Acidimicrobiia bacterium]|nr:methylmalonyl Co-A mutase-associated GTPase MeaB [Acidimicrobiia bacterium]MDH5519251.1 methylmalonyl Co-A mutase-associated GTPase MeaB [Acidimicrobiia bacterium]
MTTRTKPSIPDLYRDARAGNRLAVGRLLTRVERGGADADTVSELAHADAGSAHIVGITGAPGAGKSTLVGELVSHLVAAGRRPAVLAVDPSSPLTGGAILGDRIRMEGSQDAVSAPSVTADGDAESVRHKPFIRSMATRGHSGGLALAVPLAVRLFDALGFDPVIIETVGVGQVEVDVVGAADTAVVVATPGMGDAVQANKAGLLEVADVFVVNKADRPGATDVRRDLELMLDLSKVTGQEAEIGYRPPIVMASALEGTGATDVLDAVADHLSFLESSGRRVDRRRHRVRTEIEARLAQALQRRVSNLLASSTGQALLKQVEAGDESPTSVTRRLLDELLSTAPSTPQP